jgi:hypothetical protein
MFEDNLQRAARIRLQQSRTMGGVLGNPETLLVAQQKTRLIESAVRDRIDCQRRAIQLDPAALFSE